VSSGRFWEGSHKVHSYAFKGGLYNGERNQSTQVLPWGCTLTLITRPTIPGLIPGDTGPIEPQVLPWGGMLTLITRLTIPGLIPGDTEPIEPLHDSVDSFVPCQVSS
jgi:hypothetical protein